MRKIDLLYYFSQTLSFSHIFFLSYFSCLQSLSTVVDVMLEVRKAMICATQMVGPDKGNSTFWLSCVKVQMGCSFSETLRCLHLLRALQCWKLDALNTVGSFCPLPDDSIVQTHNKMLIQSGANIHKYIWPLRCRRNKIWSCKMGFQFQTVCKISSKLMNLSHMAVFFSLKPINLLSTSEASAKLAKKKS